MWFLHALARHIEVTDDFDLAIELMPTVTSIVDNHVEGTRYGIRIDPEDDLVTQGAEGFALTWMDARVDGVPITARVGKTVEINALWISALAPAFRPSRQSSVCRATDHGVCAPIKLELLSSNDS